MQCVSTIQKGIPLGNLTSQLFANIYLNELDQFAKHHLKIKNYARYCDDFVLIMGCRDTLQCVSTKIQKFLLQNLKLQLHPDKIILRKPNQGMDFLGYVVFPHHKILRTKTKKRMLKKIKEKRKLLQTGDIFLKSFRQTIMSYLGVCSHAEAYYIQKEIRKIYREEYSEYVKKSKNIPKAISK